MCLTPRIIVNPTYVKRCNEYPTVYMNGKIFGYQRHPLYSFAYQSFNFRRWGVNPDNVDEFYAFNQITGEKIAVYLAVPCGKCLECRESKRSQIYNRMLCEQIGHTETPLFFTLTYNDANLPSCGVSKLDVRLFFNRFYTYLKRVGYKGSTPRHIVFSEYSPEKLRPHYHGIIFGLDVASIFPRYLDFVDWFEKIWGKGFINIKHFLPHGFKYCSKYILKEKYNPCGLNPNFWFGSRQGGGIGSSSLLCPEFIDAVNKNLSTHRFKFKICGELHTVTVPKYLIDKIYPTVARTIPKEIRDAVYSLRLCLDNMHQLLSLNPHLHCLEKYDFVFPRDLMSSYPYFNYIFDESQHRSLLENEDYIRTLSPSNLINQYDELCSILRNWIMTPDYDRFIFAYRHHDRLFAQYYLNCEKYVESLPPAPEREQMLINELTKLNQRTHFAG
ncbi:replication initiator protein [Sigmofec virus UA08Rod_4626]|uniref:Replication initiator protein n=1 Tax=Sigmofec virus UA08Rod_4626 TaxID=2929405 RepID=A0A976N1E3_9VIRU|nr:replication initiator protein [Sigmofec virus UA08Rod_4626]